MRQDKIDQAVTEHTAMLTLIQNRGAELSALAGRVVERFHRQNRLLIAGSGPLAAVASLVATGFAHHLTMERPQLPAVALTGDAALAAALARDDKGRDFLSRQVRAMAQPGDVLLVVSDGRQDKAVIEALTTARQLDCLTALVQGQGEVPDPAPDFVFQFESTTLPRVAEGCLLFGQLLCELVEADLFGF